MSETALAHDGKIVGQQQRNQLVLFGRFMLPDSSEHPCQVVRISPDGAVFLTNKEIPAGVQIVAYIDEIGRVEAQVADALAGGFGVRFQTTEARKAKLTERLEWLKQRDDEDSIEQREHQRFEPTETRSHITLPDGRVYPCEVIDFSLSGAAVATEVMPALGTYVMLGKMRGRVVRYLQSGVAIEFSKQLQAGTLSGKL